MSRRASVRVLWLSSVSLLAALAAGGLACGSPVPVDRCDVNAVLVDGVCRPLCSDETGCLVGEVCREGACLPAVPVGPDAQTDAGEARPDRAPGEDAEVAADAPAPGDAEEVAEAGPPDAARDSGVRRDAEVVIDGGPGRQPDLRVAMVANLSGPLLVDEVFPVAVTIDNIGTQASGASQVALFLNPPGAFEPGPSSVRIGLVAVNSVSAAASAVVTINARLPAATLPGERNLIAVVDPEDTVVESDEVNNTFSVGTVDVTTITTDAASLDFGTTIARCGQAMRTLTIVNRSSAVAVDVTSIALASMSPVFELRPGMTPLTLAPNAQTSVTLLFHPEVAGSAMGLLEVRHTQGGSPLRIPLTGVGTTQAVDRLRAADQVRRGDVVLVVDPRMDAGLRADLMAQAPTLLADLTARVITYQVGVVQAGGLVSRGFIGTPAFITPNTPNAANELASRIAAASSAVPLENNGFTEIERALDATNPGLRPAAWLEVIVVGDHDDDTAVTPMSLASSVQAEKATPGVSAVSGIINGGQSLCPAGVEAMPRYGDLVAMTGGRSASICAPDWSAVLTTVGGRRFGAPFTYPLSQAPDASSIRVTVGGVVAPDTDFSYDGANNRVILVADATPAPNADVEIAYTVACP